MNLVSEPHEEPGTDRVSMAAPKTDASKQSARNRFPLLVTLSAAILVSLGLWGAIIYLGQAGHTALVHH